MRKNIVADCVRCDNWAIKADEEWYCKDIEHIPYQIQSGMEECKHFTHNGVRTKCKYVKENLIKDYNVINA